MTLFLNNITYLTITRKRKNSFTKKHINNNKIKQNLILTNLRLLYLFATT